MGKLKVCFASLLRVGCFVLTRARLGGWGEVWFKNFYKVSLLFSYSTGIIFKYVAKAFKAKPVANIRENPGLTNIAPYSNRLAC